MRSRAEWQSLFEAKAQELYPASDPSHDILHIRRVVRMAMKLAVDEGRIPRSCCPRPISTIS